MSSLNALKYKVTVHPSYSAGTVIFLLYVVVIIVSLFVVPLTLSSSVAYITLLLIACYAGYRAYRHRSEFSVSESGYIERKIANKHYQGKISTASFYNDLFIFLIIEIESPMQIEKSSKQFMTIYKDAVNIAEYRLLARLIKSGRA